MDMQRFLGLGGERGGEYAQRGGQQAPHRRFMAYRWSVLAGFVSFCSWTLRRLLGDHFSGKPKFIGLFYSVCKQSRKG